MIIFNFQCSIEVKVIASQKSLNLVNVDSKVIKTVNVKNMML